MICVGRGTGDPFAATLSVNGRASNALIADFCVRFGPALYKARPSVRYIAQIKATVLYGSRAKAGGAGSGRVSFASVVLAS